MGSDDAPIVSSRVPFKWEEAAGKPIAAHESPCDGETVPSHPTSLQLPPKLQFPHPLSRQQSPCATPSRLHQRSPVALQRRHDSPPPNHRKLKRLYTYMFKAASWSQPLHSVTHPSPSWSGSACAITDADQQDKLTIREGLFFVPKEFKYSLSMPDSWKAQLPIHQEYTRRDALITDDTHSFLATDKHESESNTSSPLHPLVFHESHSPASQWQPTSTKASKELGGDDDDDGDDEGFHDFFSTASSSIQKCSSKRTGKSMESSCSSTLPWCLDFGPEEPEVHEERGGRKLVVRLVAIVKLKKIIVSQVSKLRKRREGTIHQANHSSMWSPTLATYLFNEQKEERENCCPCLNDHIASGEDIDDDDDIDDDVNDDDDSPSISSVASSHRFRINPDYHLPSPILRGHLHPENDFSESEGSSSFRVQFSEEEATAEEEPHILTRRLSLREQLEEFDDEYLLQFAPISQSLTPQIVDSQIRGPTPSKGMCKVRRTVKVLAATIKLMLVHMEVGKRRGQRPSLNKYSHCLKPTLSTLSPVPSTHK